MKVVEVSSEETQVKVDSIRQLLDAAFEGEFSDSDWENSLGGSRFLGYMDEDLIAHGAVVPRMMAIDGRQILVGYVEAIAVHPEHWGRGYGAALMKVISEYCEREYELSMLSTSEKAFYMKSGWVSFHGQSYVKQGELILRTADEDEGLMYLPGKGSLISPVKRAICDWRSGDSW